MESLALRFPSTSSNANNPFLWPVSAHLFKFPFKTWIAIIPGLFAVLVVWLACFNRLATDDYYYLHNAQKLGVWGSVIHEYNTWATGYAGHLVNHYVLTFPLGDFTLPVFVLLGTALLVAILTWLISNVFKSFEIVAGKGERLLLAGILASGLFLSTVGIGELWFWIVAHAIYFWSLLAALVLVAVLCSPLSRWWHWPLLLVAAAFLGGSQPALSLAVLGFSLLRLFITILQAKKKPINRLFLLRTGLMLLVLSGGFAVYYFGPGRAIRTSILSPLPIGEAVLLNVKMTGIFLLKKLPLRLLLMIPFWLLLALLGINKKEKAHFPVTWRAVTLLVVLWGFSCFFYLLPTTQLLHDIAPDRALGPLTFTLFLGGCYFAILWPWKSPRPAKGWVLFPVGVLNLLLGATLLQQAKTSVKYAGAVDDIIELLKTAKPNEQGIVVLDSLPSAGFLYSAEITTDTIHHKNRHLKLGLELNFPVQVKD